MFAAIFLQNFEPFSPVGDQCLHIFRTDFNECKDGTKRCDGVCFNTMGSYECRCPRGFVLNADQKSCDGTCHSPLSNKWLINSILITLCSIGRFITFSFRPKLVAVPTTMTLLNLSILQSDLVNPCFFNPYASQSEHPSR